MNEAFKITTTTVEDIYRPIEVVADTTPGEVIVGFINMTESTQTDLGIFLEPASNVGDVDNPADFAPHIDYQQILTWGTEGTGGIDIYYPEDSLTPITIKRGVGANLQTKIPVDDILSNESITVRIVFNKPITAAARRLFVNIAIG